VNEEKNPESEEIWTPYININLRITVVQRIYIYNFILKYGCWYIALLLKIWYISDVIYEWLLSEW